MIKNISGLMGAGKGVYTVIKTIEELQDTERHIVTNFAYRVNPWVRSIGKRRSRGEKGFKAHLMDEFGADFDVEKRIHIISDDEMAMFYLWRIDPDGNLLRIKENRNERTGSVESFDEKAFTLTQPCCYVVDEAQRFWGARNWQKTADALSFYVTQHRKAGDDVWVACQHLSQLDKQLRVLFQEYHTCVNHKFRKIAGFRQPNVISVIVSNEAPESRMTGLGNIPKMIRFDPKGIGACYDTASGVGVQGRAADILNKPKGLPIWALMLLIVGIGFGIILAAKGMGWGAGKLLTGGFDKKTGQSISNAVAINSKPWNPLQVEHNQPKSYSPVTVSTNDVEIFMSGFAYLPAKDLLGKPIKGVFTVFLTDGTHHRFGEHGDVRALTEDYCIIEGKKYRMKP